MDDQLFVLFTLCFCRLDHLQTTTVERITALQAALGINGSESGELTVDSDTSDEVRSSLITPTVDCIDVYYLTLPLAYMHCSIYRAAFKFSFLRRIKPIETAFILTLPSLDH
jgi:hypothetical protein